MKHGLYSLFALLPLAFYGCSEDYRCDLTNQAETESLWCPRLDTAIVEWMPKIEKITPYYTEMADCERFGAEYIPQHELLKPCVDESVQGKFELRAYAIQGHFAKDSNLVSMYVSVMAYSDKGATRTFQDHVAKVIFEIYGCTEYNCSNAKRVHVYIKEGISYARQLYSSEIPKEEERISLDQWFTPEHFKIVETNSNPPSASDGYYRYHHFRLILDAPTIKTTIKSECDSNCYKDWNTPSISIPPGG